MILLFVLWRINAVLPDITIGTWKLKLQETTTSNISTQVSVYDVTYHLEGGDNSILNPTQLSTEDYKNHIIDSRNQCPQGLCMTEKYVIVTSYSVDEKKALGTMAFYDRITGNHVKTFGMEEESHLGGVTYDGENIWVCHSGTREIERIDYAFIEKLIDCTTQNFIDISRCFSRYEIRNVPSCMYYANGKIYVATHKVLTTSIVKEYEYKAKENTLTYCETYRIPAKTQGIAIDHKNQVYVSTSYGRRRSSNMMVYQSLKQMDKAVKKPLMTIELPPGSEEVYLDENMIYLLFETACSKYYEGSDGNGNCPYHIDKILMITKDSIFYD